MTVAAIGVVVVVVTIGATVDVTTLGATAMDRAGDGN